MERKVNCPAAKLHLWRERSSARGFSDESLLTEMVRVEASPLIAIVIVTLGVAMVVGKGPLTTAFDLFRKFKTKHRPTT